MSLQTQIIVALVLFAIMMYNGYLMISKKKIRSFKIEGVEEIIINSQSPDKKTQMMFDRAKNPWNLTIQKFKAIRAVGSVVGMILLVIGFFTFGAPYGLLPGGLTLLLAWWYPSYYYKAIGEEREAEWNKMYQFIWILKNNLTLYDPKQAFQNTHDYIAENFPNDKELIQGFQDFADYYSTDGIHPYVKQFYPFSTSKEIVQIAFNSQNTGTSPDQQLDQLRDSTLNQQDKYVIKTLATVSSQATIASLPFMLISMILALMVPMIMQFVKFM